MFFSDLALPSNNLGSHRRNGFGVYHVDTHISKQPSLQFSKLGPWTLQCPALDRHMPGGRRRKLPGEKPTAPARVFKTMPILSADRASWDSGNTIPFISHGRK